VLGTVALGCLALAFQIAARAQSQSSSAVVAEALLWGRPMAAASQTADLPADVQKALGEYRSREQAFRTSLKAARNASAEEEALFGRRVGVERSIVCLFPRRDTARIAASYASDAEIAIAWEGQSDSPRLEAAFIDGVLRDQPQTWLAPYLNLIAGHRKLCASQLDGSDTQARRDATAADARRQLTQARGAGHPLIGVAADHLLTTGRCLSAP
jgi:hypothetical protein